MIHEYFEQNCIVCGSYRHDEIYSSTQPAGELLGQLLVRLHACGECGFVWQNPQLSQDVLTAYYMNDVNASGSVFHASGANSGHSKKQRDRIDFFKPMLTSPGFSRAILEIGCSTGEFLSALDLPNWDKYGIEPSVTAATVAESRGIALIQQSIDDIELGREKFSAVAAFSVLEHLSNLPKIMSNIANSLKSGGFLLFEIPDSMKAEPQLADFFGYEHLWHFTEHSVVNFLSRYGLNVLKFDSSVTDARLRAIAIKGTPKNADEEEAAVENSSSLRFVVKQYHDRRMLLIRETGKRIEGFLKDLSPQSNFAIYGAGIHTLHLLNYYKILKEAVCVIDSNPVRWGTTVADIPIVGIQDATSSINKVDKIVISSRAFEEEIYDSLVIRDDLNHCEILKLYSG